ncbi:helix-turn-helix transcriptional regulator [Streptomyces sp. ITFR-16]|uniref:helix-turn-helix transcriptional regulator n=1 Tax=Streptomyces sp. ITFR-16 TaxID=3075198 RepID=UPI00288BD1B8|nr:helix-turn-helix transcriptional regulator [Streptomyces sp. ITFR-16]WNI23887.1 helix-turn-helix transcriptional regulator [Streptomyces sp. ITFR-16]
MLTTSIKPTHPHLITELCDEGARLYGSALGAGRIARSEIGPAPCLLEFGLLHPDPDDANWLRPVPPSAVLAQRLHPLEREIRERRRVTIELADAFEPFMAISAQPSVTTHAITVLEGLQTINATLDTATAQCTKEILTIQPGGVRNLDVLTQSLERVEGPLSRGVRLRTLYQHTARHGAGVFAYLERLHTGSVEIRTLEELIDRMIIFDRTVAVIPARRDRQVALELRHPGLVDYLVSVFDQFWQLATPLSDETPYTPPNDGVTGIQRSIAKLLIEGYVDEAIARRLGMNVRTCRAHVAKLSAALGSNSRAQLGYLIARSGILQQDS